MSILRSEQLSHVQLMHIAIPKDLRMLGTSD